MYEVIFRDLVYGVIFIIEFLLRILGYDIRFEDFSVWNYNYYRESFF